MTINASEVIWDQKEEIDASEVVWDFDMSDISPVEPVAVQAPPGPVDYEFEGADTFWGDPSFETPDQKPDTDVEMPFLEGAKVLAGQAGTMITDIIPETIGRALRGGDEDLADDSWLDTWINKNEAERERRRTLSPEEAEKTWFKVPFTDIKVTMGDAENAADSIGYSIVNAIATFGARAIGKAAATPLGPVGQIIVGTASGLAAGTFVSGRATKDQFIDEMKDAFLKAHEGEKITPDLEDKWQTLYANIAGDANWYGFWEAAPETAGNMLTLGIVKFGKGPITKAVLAPLKKKIAAKVASEIGRKIAAVSGKAVGGAGKLAAMLTEESLTETLTTKKQSEIEAHRGLRERPLTYVEAFEEVLPIVLITTPFMGGAVSLGEKAARTIAGEVEQKPTKPPPPPGIKASEALESTAIGLIKEGMDKGDLTPDDVEQMRSKMDKDHPFYIALGELIKKSAPKKALQGERLPVLEKAVAKVTGEKEVTAIKVKPKGVSKSVVEIGEVLGLEVALFKGEGGINTINGLHEEGTIYINEKAADPYLVVLGHESFHRLKKGHKDLHTAFMKLASGTKIGFDDYVAELNKKRKKFGFKKDLTVKDARAKEEFVAEFVGEQFKNPQFWKKLHKADPVVGKQLATIVKDLVIAIRDALRGKKKVDSKYFADLDKIQDALAGVYAEFTRREKKVEDATVVELGGGRRKAPTRTGPAIPKKPPKELEGGPRKAPTRTDAAAIPEKPPEKKDEIPAKPKLGRHDGWRTDLIKARQTAINLGLTGDKFTGDWSKLEDIVAVIDEFDKTQAIDLTESTGKGERGARKKAGKGKSLDEQIADQERIDREQKAKNADQLKETREALKDLPIKVDAIGYEGSQAKEGEIQVTFTDGTPDTFMVPADVDLARKDIESRMKDRAPEKDRWIDGHLQTSNRFDSWWNMLPKARAVAQEVGLTADQVDLADLDSIVAGIDAYDNAQLKEKPEPGSPELAAENAGIEVGEIEQAIQTAYDTIEKVKQPEKGVTGGLNKKHLDKLVDLHNRGDVYALRDILKVTEDAKEDIAKEGTVVTAEYYEGRLPSMPSYKKEGGKWYRWDGSSKWIGLSTRAKNPWYNLNDVKANLESGNLTKTSEDRATAPPEEAPAGDIDSEVENLSDDEIDKIVDETGEEEPAAPEPEGKPILAYGADLQKGDRVRWQDYGEKWTEGTVTGKDKDYVKIEITPSHKEHKLLDTEFELLNRVPGEKPTRGPKVPPKKREKKAPKPKPEIRKLASILEDAAKEGISGVDEALTGLYDLFGGGKTISMGIVFDEDTYKKAKPHFESAYAHMKESKKNLKDFVAFVVERFGKAVKPYIRRFVKEVKAAIKAAKAALGKFENVGYVYDPEELARGIAGKTSKSAVRIIADKMAPGKIWGIAHPEGTTPGMIRLMSAVQKNFNSFKEFIENRASLGQHSYRRDKKFEARVENWMDAGHDISELQDMANEYGKYMETVVNTFSRKTSIMEAIGSLHEKFLANVATTDPQHYGSYPEFDDASDNLTGPEWDTNFFKVRNKRYLYTFLTDTWSKYLAQENDILLSEINIHKRTKNKEVIRTGLEDYREGKELIKSEDLQQPFNFKGVGYGTVGWINQEERARVVNASYDAFKDLADVINAPDNGMGLGGELAVQFANLGHKAKGAAAAYFPGVQTINFTRDSGDGTMAHEWSHGFHYLAPDDTIKQLENLIEDFYHTYDFEAGVRMADDLMAVDSSFMKRVVDTKKQSRLDYVKDEVKKRYEDAVKKRTDYYKTAIQIDPDYTAWRTEMWARAFEAYVYDTLGGRNNYLVNDFVEAGRIGGKGQVGQSSLVYPVGKEREAFSESIAHFLDGISWDQDGVPSMKDDYVELESLNEEKLAEGLKELMDQIEERYKAIWSSEPSADGNFWYRYDATALAPMMQPDGYVGFDKKYKEDDQQGDGAVAYLTQLHPDDILGYKFTNIQYEGNATYISPEGGTKNELGEEGEESLDKVPTSDDSGPKERGDLREGDIEGGDDGEGGTRRPGKERGTVPGELGDSDERIHLPAAGNYRITDETINQALPVSDRFNSNLAAIKVLRLTEEEDRSPTSVEKDILAGYTGWGGMSELFAWQPGKAWASRADLIKAELTEDEIRRAEESSVSSYYTPVPVARFMWKLAQRLGFENGHALDPAFGANGVFTGTMPADLSKTVSMHGVEKDGLSTRIAQKLYELANIENLGFEDSKKPLNRFNLTITNIPFANYSPSDKKHNKSGFKIHNYYINKMLDLTAPGGLNMVIATSNTMDKAGPYLAEYAKKADFVGAIRLPSDLYSSTSVVTDILVFRKKIQGSDFVGIAEKDWTTSGKDEGTGLTINTYFTKHPDMIAGTLETVADRWGKEGLRVVKDSDDIGRELAEKAVAFPENILELEVKAEEISLDDIIAAPGTIKEGGIYINDSDKVSQSIDGQEVLWPTKTPAEKKKANIGRGFIKILDQVRTVLRSQKENLSEAIVKADQKTLKKYYNAFVKKFGAINEKKNYDVYDDITDAHWVITLENYDPDTKKVIGLADIFTKKIVGTEKRPDFANTDHDALAMALDEFGYPNLEYMAKLRNSDPGTVLKGVLDKVIENPETGIIETMDEYLAGNVRRKLAVAREMAKSNPEYERNVKMLEAAQPDDIPPHRIVARIGAPWIVPGHLADFVKEKIEMRDDLTPVFNFNPVTFLWSMSFKGRARGYRGEVKAETKRAIEKYKKSVAAKSVWGTPRMNFFTLLGNAIQGNPPVVTYMGADRKIHTDEVATAGAEAKLQEIQREFNRWLFADQVRSDEAVERFNEIVNTSTTSKYDGSHLTFPGKSLSVLTAKEAKELGADGRMVFYDHQVNAVWQYLRNGNIYLAHEVGTGKTMTMAMIAMEARRLKGKKKVVYVTLNDSTLGQAIEEIKMLYPLANIMPIQVSTIAERQRHQLQKMALNDFDIAIMRQQDLDKIALSPQAERVFIDQDLQELRVVLEEAKAEGARILERDIQERILALEAKLKEPGAFEKEKEDQKIYFDDIGIDLLIVDEAHQYKNIPYATRLNRVTGLNPAGSKTAQSFFRKTQYLNAQFQKQDGVVMASGTPLTNSIGEFFNLQRVLQPNEVKRQGLWRFDRWIASYGEIGSQMEWDGTRQIFKQVTTNKRIVNAGRLLATAFQNIDSVLADDTKIIRPETYGGQPIAVSIQPNQYVEHYFSEIVTPRLAEIESDPKDAEFEGTPDNMLRVISNMSAMAIDQRLLVSKVPHPEGKVDSKGKAVMVSVPGPYANTELQEDSKIYQASRNIYKRWVAEKKDKGVQLVFADIGVPGRFVKRFKYKTDDEIAKMSVTKLKEYEEDKFESENSALGFNTYDGIKDELVKLGIPRKEIAYIHDTDDTNKQRKASKLRQLFKRVRNGDVRVMIGSTKKAGTGVNVQERVSDVLHIDVWWNFSDWVQRNGRALRSGNIYVDKGGVRVWNYITELSVDAHRWSKMFAKGRVLQTALSGDINVDVIEDMTTEVMSAKEMEAIGSNNPLLLKQSELLRDTQAMGLEQSSYKDTVRDARGQLAVMPQQIRGLESRRDSNEQSRAIMENITAVQFTGSDKTLVLKKHGKEISAALEAAVETTRPNKYTVWWDKEHKEPLLVFGTHTEADVETEVDGKKKKVKEYTFQPTQAQALMESANKDYAKRWLTIRNGITSNVTTLADFIKTLGAKKKKPAEITGNVSRALTEFISGVDRVIESATEEIAVLNDKKPSLEKVVATPWPKEVEFADAQKELAEVEAQMAAGPQGADPAQGLSIHQYTAPVPMLDDFAAKDRWKAYGRIVYPKEQQFNNDNPPFAIDRDAFDVPKFFFEHRKKFKPTEEYYPPNFLDILTDVEAAGPVIQRPEKFTTKDEVTKFWVNNGPIYFSIDPNTWNMVDRIVGSAGDWHYRSFNSEQFLVHHSADGKKDAIIQIQLERKVPEGIKRGQDEGADLSIKKDVYSEIASASVKSGPWYSQMQNTLSAKLPGKGTPQSMKQTIESFANKGEFKKEELEWSGVIDWLSEQEGKVTKQKVLDYLDSNKVEIDEVVKGGQDEAPWVVWDGTEENYFDTENAAIQYATTNKIKINDISVFRRDDEGETKFSSSSYTLPGGENYREFLMMMPEQKSSINEEKIKEKILQAIEKESGEKFTAVPTRNATLGIVGTGRGDYVGGLYDKLDQYYDGVFNPEEQYHSSHWEESNVLTHIRFNERTDADGAKVLFIEEIQSDWHQEGRKKGYGKTELPPSLKIARTRKEEMPNGEIKYFIESEGGTLLGAAGSEESATRIAKATIEREKQSLSKRVPNAPFKKTWPMLAIKRMVRYATENGFDKIAWTPGDIQAERYDLSKKISKVLWIRMREKGKSGILLASDLNGKQVINETISENQIEDYIGKEPAKKLIGAKDEIQGNGLIEQKIEGLDLKVGGEEMKSFYDRMLVNQVNKFFNKKAWGKAKVGVGKINEAQTTISIRIPNGDILVLSRDGDEWYAQEPLTGTVRGGPEDNYQSIVKQLGGKVIEEGMGTEVWILPITPAMREKSMVEGFPMFSIKRMEPVAAEYLAALKAADPTAFTAPSEDITADVYEGLPEAVQKRIKAAKGLGRQTMIAKVKETAGEIFKSATRHRPYLDPKEEGAVANVLRIHQEVPENSARRTVQVLMRIGGDMKPKQYEAFSMKLLVDDMQKDIDSGLLDKDDLPFGFNKETLAGYTRVINKIVESDPVIDDALSRRDAFNSRLKKALVNADLLPKSVLEDDRYFHHQVLQYRALKEMGEEYRPGVGISSRDVHLKKKGWQRARVGSTKDYNTEYAEAEFEVISQSLAQLETKSTLNRLKSLVDISNNLRKRMKIINKKEKGINSVEGWKDLIPSDYVIWKPAPGSSWYRAYTITDRLVESIQNGEVVLGPENANKIKTILARGKDAEWVVKTDIAKTMDGFDLKLEDHLLSKASRKAMSAWKQWILINPMRIIKYNLNNMSGDLDITMAYDPKILKYMKTATKDLYKELRNKEISKELRADLDEAHTLGVIGSGWSVQEVGDINMQLAYDKHMAALTGEAPHLIKRAWKNMKSFTTYRENLLRLAAFRYFKDRIDAGEKNIYAASNKEEVDAITNGHERSAKLARELVGDYGNITNGGQWLRRHLLPFYAWMEINAPRYVRLIRNLKHEGKSGKFIPAAIAWKGTKLGAKVSALYAMVMIWNRVFFPDEEDELGESQRRQFHLILGRRDDGSIISLRFQGALSDALSWFGGEDIVSDIKDVVSGKTPISAKATEAALATPIKIINAIRPDIKGFAEILGGKSFYPDPFNPRPIRDKIQQTLRTFSLDKPYKWLAGKPVRGDTTSERFLLDLLSIAFYTSDPGESAYYDIKAKTYDWSDRQGIEHGSATPTSRSNALYFYKQALKYGDLQAAQKYLRKYMQLGGSTKGMKISVARAHPLASMAKKNWNTFLRTLTPDELERYRIALAWYNATYKSRRPIAIQPKSGQGAQKNLTLKQAKSILKQ